MRRLSLPLVILVSILIAAVLTWLTLGNGFFRGRDGGTLRTSVTPITIGPFKRLDIAGQAEVTLVQGAAEAVSIETPAPDRSRLRVVVRGDTLHIEYEDREPWWSAFLRGSRGRSPEILVTFRELESIDTAGSVKIAAAQIKVPELRISGAGGTSVHIDDLQTQRLRVSGAGALKAEIAGRAIDQTLSISGAGEYRGARLISDNATVSVAGAGRVVVNAEKTLKATISGAGSVEYLGDPQVTRRISGAGSVRKREAAVDGARIALVE